MRIRELLKSLRPTVGVDNHRAIDRWLEQALLRIPSHSRILDAGAGPQRHREYCGHLEYVSQDFAEYDGKGDGTALQTPGFSYGKLDITSDITAIPEPDSSFDAVMCIGVLEHVPDPVLAIREFSRLLKPSGHLIITAPFCSLTHLAPYHFCTGFNKYWFQQHLAENNLKAIEMSPNGNFFEFVAQEVYRTPSISSRYAHGKPYPIEWLSIYIIQRMLMRFSKTDTGSSELLCYGYNVYARKQPLAS